jgi:4-amino-4-deoxy-L-arabinose transferase-like glycosyltransferase
MLPLAAWFVFRQPTSHARPQLLRLLVIWIATIVLFFSLSRTKEDLYILPIVPVEAALIGAAVAAALNASGGRAARGPDHWLRWSLIAAGLACLLAGAVVFWLFVHPGQYSLRGMAATSIIVMASGGAVVVAAAIHRLFPALVVLSGSLIVVAWLTVLVALPDFERYKPVKPFSAIIQARASTGAIVGSYRFALPTMVYYLQRPVMEVVEPDHLRSAFQSRWDVYFLIPESEYAAIKHTLPVPTFVLARRPMFDIKPRNFLEGTALPQMLLVSNRSESW